MRPRCGKPIFRGSKCGRPEGHETHCVSVEAVENMRLRNARRIAAAKLLDEYLRTR